MKSKLMRILLVVALLILGLIIILKVNSKSSQKPIIKVNSIEVQLETSAYHDITARGYVETDRRDWIYLFTRTMEPSIYVGTDSYGTVDFLDKEDALIDYIGLDVDETVHQIKIGDADFLNTSKEQLAKDFDLIEFNGKVRLIYEDYYFVCLSYVDDKLDGFAVMYNVDGKQSVREVDLDFRNYKDQWIMK